MRPLRRPSDFEFEKPVRILPGTSTLERWRAARLIALRSFSVLIEVEHGAADNGVLVAHGDQGGGYSVYVEDGRLRLAYNQYGDLRELDAGQLAHGRRTIALKADAVPNFEWNLALLVDDVEAGRLDGAHMLIGLSPFEGIDVAIDRRSPVHWGVYERHGPFPYTGRLLSVTYTPGEKLDVAQPALARATQAATRIYE
jgi:arylsulfatase